MGSSGKKSGKVQGRKPCVQEKFIEVQGRFRGTVQGKFREGSENSENSGKVQGKIQGEFRESPGKVQGDSTESSWEVEGIPYLSPGPNMGIIHFPLLIQGF